MTYSITLAPPAARQLRKFDPQVRRRIQAALELLAGEPRPPAATQLVGGSGEWRVRTGDYRIVYEIEDDQLLVLVLSIGHRIYREQAQPPQVLEEGVEIPGGPGPGPYHLTHVGVPTATDRTTHRAAQQVDHRTGTGHRQVT